jgi:hypothetical protein
MADAIGIANSALRKIGAGRISAFDDGDKNANAVSDLYDPLRLELLRAHNWNFAARWTKLARLSGTPAAGFRYFFALPSDWVRTIQVADNDAGVGDVDYREESDGTALRIACSSEEVWARCVTDVSDANRMTPDFREALACALARDLAIPIAQSNTLREEMKDAVDKALRRAKSTDAISDRPEPRRSGSWASIRSGGLDRPGGA